MSRSYRELPLGAQTAYAELLEQTRLLELDALSTLVGSFQRRTIKGRRYVYFGYRDPLDGTQRRIYVGPDDERVKSLTERFEQVNAPRKLAPPASAAIALGCASVPGKHYRIVRQLAGHGFFRSGGVLVGTHAFVAMSNALGIRWAEADVTLDLDFAHSGNNVSLALPSDVRLSVHDALTSLELGLLPSVELEGRLGSRYANPRDPELRVDFLTSLTRSRTPAAVERLGVVLEPISFMDYALEGTTQVAVLARQGASLVNIPSPERYAVHKLIVYAERRKSDRAKATKDLVQAAALAEWHLEASEARTFNAAWRDALGRGPGWRRRARQGMKALLERRPELDAASLWRT